MAIEYFGFPVVHTQATTIITTDVIGDDTARASAVTDLFRVYADTYFGDCGDYTLDHDRNVYFFTQDMKVRVTADGVIAIDARTTPNTTTNGIIDFNFTTATNSGVSGLNINMITHALANGEWAYNFYGTYDTSACAAATSNAAVIYLATPVADAQCNDYGIYIDTGYDWGIACKSPVLLSSLTIAPLSDPTPYPLNFELAGWPGDATGTVGVYTQGRVITMQYSAARTLDGALYGAYMDFTTSVTPADQNVVGTYIMVPQNVGAGSYGISILTVADRGAAIYVDCNLAAGVGGQTVVGGDFDFTSAAVDAGTLYGIRVQMPAAYGAATEAAMYITGGGNQIGLLEGSQGIYMNVLNATIGVPMWFDMEVFETGTIYTISYSVAETLTGALTGISVDLSTNVAPADQNVVGISLTIPANVGANSRGVNVSITSDRGTGLYVDWDGVIAAAQIFRGIVSESAGSTLNHAGAEHYELYTDLAGITLTNFNLLTVWYAGSNVTYADPIDASTRYIRGIHLDYSTVNVVANSGAGSTYLIPIDVDLSGTATADFNYGMRVTMPAVYGAGEQAALYMTGNGNTVRVLDGAYGLFSSVSNVGDYAAYLAATTTNLSNDLFAGWMAKDLTISAAAAANHTITNNALYVRQNTLNNNDDVAGYNITANNIIVNLVASGVMNTTAATTDTYGATLLRVALNVATQSVTGTDTMNCAARALDVTYTTTATTGVLNLNATDVARVDFNVGAATVIGGDLNMLSLDGTGFDPNTTPAAGRIVTGANIDWSGCTITNSANWTLYGLQITMPATHLAFPTYAAINATGNGDTFAALSSNGGIYLSIGPLSGIGINEYVDATGVANAKIGMVISKDMSNATGGALAMTNSIIDITANLTNSGAGSTVTWNDYFIDLDYSANQAAVANTWSGGFLSMVATQTAGTLSIQGDMVTMTLVGTQTGTLRGILLDFDQTPNGQAFYGIDIDTAGVTLGAGAEYSLYIHGVADDWVRIEPTTTGGMLYSADLSTEFTAGTVFDARFVAATALLTGTLAGINLDFETNVTDANNVTVVGYYARIPANVSAASYGLSITTYADQGAGIMLDVNSNIAVAQTLNGLLIDADGATLGALATGFYPIHIDASAITHTGGEVRSIIIELPAAFTDALTMEGIYITGNNVSTFQLFSHWFGMSLDMKYTVGAGASGIDNPWVAAFNGDGITLNRAAAEFVGVSVDISGVILTSYTSTDGVKITMPGTHGAGTDRGIYILGDHTNLSNAMYGIYVSKDIGMTVAAAADYTSSNDAAYFAVALANADDGGFDMISTSNVLNVVYSHANTATVAPTADQIAGAGINLSITGSTGANAKSIINTFTTRAIDIAYALTFGAASTFNFDATDVFRINFDVGAGIVIANGGAGNLNMMYLDGNGFIPGATVANATTISGLYVDWLNANLAADAQATLYGIRIVLPANYGANGGGAGNAAIYATGNGVTQSILDAAIALKSVMTATSQAMSIDQVATDATEKDLIYADIDCAAITGAAYFRAAYMNIDETVVGNDGSFIVGYQVDVTGFATGRADLMGMKILLDGTKSGGDISKGIYIDADMTLNNASEILKAMHIDMTGITTTLQDSVAGIAVQMSAGVFPAIDTNLRGTSSGRIEQGAACWEDDFDGRVNKGQWTTDAVNNAGDVNVAAPTSDDNGRSVWRTNAGAGVFERHWNDIFDFDSDEHPTFEAGVYVEAYTQANNDIQIGLTDTNVTGVLGVGTYAGFCVDVADNKIYAVSAKAGVAHKADTGVTWVQGNYYVFRVETINNGIATGMKWYINGTLVATSDAAAEIPGTGVKMQPRVWQQTTGAPRSSIAIDYVKLWNDRVRA